MLSYGSFSDLTFSGNKNSVKAFNGKVINIGLTIERTRDVPVKVLKIESTDRTERIVLYINVLKEETI
jgi:hypothetical protein